MRYAVLAAAIGLVVLAGAANATIPERSLCTVTPCDANGGVIVVPDYNIETGTVQPSPHAAFTVNVRNANNDAIPNAYVELILGIPGNHWLCNDAVLTGTTDPLGDVSFNISGGGCTMNVNALRIIANNYPIREYDVVKSPDYENGVSNGTVDLADFGYFAACYGTSNCPCTDYKNSGLTELEDFSIFAESYGYACQELVP